MAKLPRAIDSKKIAWILDHVENRDVFLRDLFVAISLAVKTGSIDPLITCIEEWYATAEINAIPGMKQRIWDAYKTIPRKNARSGKRKPRK